MLNSFAAAVLKGAFLYQVKTDPITHFHLFFHTSVFWVIPLHERWMPLLTFLFVLLYDMQWLLNPSEKARKTPNFPSSRVEDRVIHSCKISIKIPWKKPCFFVQEHFVLSCRMETDAYAPQSKSRSSPSCPPHPLSQHLMTICKLKQV